MSQTVSLGDLINIKHGYAFKGEFFVDKPTKNILLTPGNFKIGGGFRPAKLKYYSGPIDDNYILKHNDIVVTMTDLSKAADTLGYSALIPDDNNTYLHNQRIGLVRVKDNLAVPEYIYWVLRSRKYRKWVVAGATGSTVKHTAPSKILSYRFELPDNRTQKKIVDILGTIDEKIELNRKMNETLEQMGLALFKHYFITNPAAKEWKVGTVSDLVNIYSGFAFKSTDFDSRGKYGLVTIKNVQDGNFIAACTDHLSGPLPSKVPDYAHLSSGSIILSLTGNVGRVCLVIGDDYLLNQRVARLEGVNNQQAYAYFLFRSTEMKEMLFGISRGTAQMNLSPIETKRLKINLPSDDLLAKFDKSASTILQRIVLNNQEIQNLTTLRDTLLPRLINGKLKV